MELTVSFYLSVPEQFVPGDPAMPTGIGEGSARRAEAAREEVALFKARYYE